MKQIMKALGLDEASKRLPREEAAQRAAAPGEQPDLQLPLALPGDVALHRRAPGRSVTCGCWMHAVWQCKHWDGWWCHHAVKPSSTHLSLPGGSSS